KHLYLELRGNNFPQPSISEGYIEEDTIFFDLSSTGDVTGAASFYMKYDNPGVTKVNFVNYPSDFNEEEIIGYIALVEMIEEEGPIFHITSKTVSKEEDSSKLRVKVHKEGQGAENY